MEANLSTCYDSYMTPWTDSPLTGSKPAPGDLALVQAFVNTSDLESGDDLLASRPGLRDWLRRHALPGGDATPSEEERREVVALREALRALLQAHNGYETDEQALDTVNRAAARHDLQLRFAPDGGARLEPQGTSLSRFVGLLLATVYDAIADGTWPRLKACRNDTCHWAFYDTSKNRSGAWCTMRVCGNRMKVRAHRRRHADPSD